MRYHHDVLSTRDDTPDRLIDWVSILRDSSNSGSDPFADEIDPRVEEVILAAERHHRDPSEPLVKIGRFEALGSCGAGGHGVVFRARDPKLDRQVALKVCRLRSPEAAQALVREARTLAKLTHPNIVRVYDIDDHGDEVFLVMELIESGSTLEDLIRERPPWQVIVDVMREAGRGLAAAHEQTDSKPAIIHGDFKPANVLITADGHALVADFGIGRLVLEHEPEATREQLRRRTGTPPYMAPEVLRGHPSDRKADQYSFSVTLFQALGYGKLPYAGVTSQGVLRAIENSPLPELEQAVPAALRKIVRRGMALDPSKRFADMNELLDALDRVAGPTSSGPRTAGWIAFGIALGSMLVGGLVVLMPEPSSEAAAAEVPSPAEVVPEPSEVSKSIELPYPHNLPSMCAMGDEEVSITDEELLKTCRQIRNGQLDSAQTG